MPYLTTICIFQKIKYFSNHIANLDQLKSHRKGEFLKSFPQKHAKCSAFIVYCPYTCSNSHLFIFGPELKECLK